MQRKHLLLLNRADAVTVSNDRDHQAIARRSPSTLLRTHVAPLGSLFQSPCMSEAERQQVRDEFGAGPDVHLIAYFGFLIPSRRIETIIEAASLLRSGNDAYHFLLMGGIGEKARAYVKRCRKLTESHGLQDSVHWTGFIEDEQVERYLAASDLFLTPIERGADFRNSTLLAALQAGLPIVTTENPRYGIDRELRASKVCRFFDPDSAQSLARMIEDLVHSPDEMARMKQRARTVATHHTWARHVEVLERAYQGLDPIPYFPEHVSPRVST